MASRDRMVSVLASMPLLAGKGVCCAVQPVCFGHGSPADQSYDCLQLQSQWVRISNTWQRSKSSRSRKGTLPTYPFFDMASLTKASASMTDPSEPTKEKPLPPFVAEYAILEARQSKIAKGNWLLKLMRATIAEADRIIENDSTHGLTGSQSVFQDPKLLATNGWKEKFPDEDWDWRGDYDSEWIDLGPMAEALGITSDSEGSNFPVRSGYQVRVDGA